MSGVYPQPVFTQPEMPQVSVGTLRTSDPTTKLHALGRVPASSCVAVEVNKACIITIFTYSNNQGAWLNPASSSASFQKTFTAAGWDYFVCPPGSLFSLKSDTASTTCYISPVDPA